MIRYGSFHFLKNEIAYKENMSDRTNSYKYDAVPYHPHYLFDNVDWHEKNANASVKTSERLDTKILKRPAI